MTVVGKQAQRTPEPLRLRCADVASGRTTRPLNISLRRALRRVNAARVVVNGFAVPLVVLILPGVRESTGHPVLGDLGGFAVYVVAAALAASFIVGLLRWPARRRREAGPRRRGGGRVAGRA
jgi:hypothetical protein